MKAIITILLLMLANLSLANKLVIALSPLDCAACVAGLQNRQELIRYYDYVTIAIDPIYARDSVSIVKKLPMLTESHFVLDWESKSLSKVSRAPISYAYYLDNNGNLIDESPLKNFFPGKFVNVTFKEKYSDIIDTVLNSKTFPVVIDNFLITDQLFAYINSSTQELLYRKRNDKANVQKFDAESFRTIGYTRYFSKFNPEKVRKSIDDYSSRNPNFKRAEVLSIGQQNDTFSVLVRYNFPSIPSNLGFAMIHQIRNSQIIRNLYIPDSGIWFQKRIVEKAFNSLGYDKPVKLEPEQNRQLTTLVNNLVTTDSFGKKMITPFYNSMYLKGNNSFIFPVSYSDTLLRLFAREYKVIDSSLSPNGKGLPLEYGHVYKENNLPNAFINGVGKYPFVMHRWSNEVHNLEAVKSYVLPLEIGEHDYSEAAMIKMKPKSGLFILNLIGNDSLVYVAYTMPKLKTLQYLVYNYIDRRVHYKGDLVLNHKPFSLPVMAQIHFDGPEVIYIVDGPEGLITRYFMPERFWEKKD